MEMSRTDAKANIFAARNATRQSSKGFLVRVHSGLDCIGAMIQAETMLGVFSEGKGDSLLERSRSNRAIDLIRHLDPGKIPL